MRELENLIERICLLEDGEVVRLEHLPERILRETIGKGASRGALPRATASAGRIDYHDATAGYQKSLIEQALAESAGHLAGAAQQLGLTRHALRHQIMKLGLPLPVSVPEPADSAPTARRKGNRNRRTT